MTSFSFVELFSNDYKNKINIIINDTDFNDNSVLSKILQFDDKFFKKNNLVYNNGIPIRSLINYNINIDQWTSYIKAMKIGIKELNQHEINQLEKFLAVTGGSQKLWNQISIYNKKNKVRNFYEYLENYINPKSNCHDKFKLYKKWQYYFRGASQINDDNWIKGNFNKEIGFDCALKYNKNEFNENIKRIKHQIIKEFILNNIDLPDSLFIKQYNYSILFPKSS